MPINFGAVMLETSHSWRLIQKVYIKGKTINAKMVKRPGNVKTN
jgi:hypothetical protein